MKAALPEYLKFGAVREMHGAKAAGTAIEAEVQDDGRTWFGAHIVDSEAVKKVRTRVYKGFSIGGKIVSRDKVDKTTITGIKLVETEAMPVAPRARLKAVGKAEDGNELDVQVPPERWREDLGLNDMFPFELKKGLFPRGEAGLCCDEDGVALGPVRLVEKCDEVPGKRYRICSPEVFVKAFVTAYGKPPLDVALHFYEGLGRVMKSLDEGDLTLAMMKAIFLGFPEIELERMAKLEACELGKYNPDHDAGNGRATGLGGVAQLTSVVSAEAAEQARALEMALKGAIRVVKYNHNHDPENGQFISVSGGSSNNMEEMVVTARRIPKVDRKFLRQWEGQSKIAYIPHHKDGRLMGNSGVTVGTGVDLGAQNGKSSKDAGVSPALIEKLSPYLGFHKEDAQAALAENGPLTLTQREVDELDNAVYNQYLNDARTAFNKAVDAANVADKTNGGSSDIERSHFDNLSSQTQTVIMLPVTIWVRIIKQKVANVKSFGTVWWMAIFPLLRML